MGLIEKHGVSNTQLPETESLRLYDENEGAIIFFNCLGRGLCDAAWQLTDCRNVCVLSMSLSDSHAFSTYIIEQDV